MFSVSWMFQKEGKVIPMLRSGNFFGSMFRRTFATGKCLDAKRLKHLRARVLGKSCRVLLVSSSAGPFICKLFGLHRLLLHPHAGYSNPEVTESGVLRHSFVCGDTGARAPVFWCLAAYVAELAVRPGGTCLCGREATSQWRSFRSCQSRSLAL